MTGQQYNRIRENLLPPNDANEHFGFGIASVSRFGDTVRLLLRDFIPADSSCLLSQSGASVRPDPRFVNYIWALAKKSNSSLIDFHTHPFSDKSVTFSSIDDRSEMESFPQAVQFLGNGPHASVVLGRNSLDARWYDPDKKSLQPVTQVKIIAEKLISFIPTSASKHSRIIEMPNGIDETERYDRQIRVFGKQGQSVLKRLTVGIVGAGGIGSLVFVLLVRLGVGRIIIIDPDTVEASNLNRLSGSTIEDASKKTPKVRMLKRYAAKINPDIKVVAVLGSILEDNKINALKLCDVVFGCTDNEGSRWTLNKFSVEQVVPYLDTGTGAKADAQQNIEHAGGQVRIVIPGSGCLNCISGIDTSIAQQEMMPEPDRQFAQRLGYIDGADIKAPAVASLNGPIANLAVTEFLAFVTGFKGLRRYVFYDFMKTRVECCSFEKDPNCFTCSKTGSFAIGDEGKPLPAELLLDEPVSLIKGESLMKTETVTIEQSIRAFLAKAEENGLEVEGNAEGRWFMLKNLKTASPFSNRLSKLLVKFPEGTNNPVILVPDIAIRINFFSTCSHFATQNKWIKGWQLLCPHIFDDVGTDLFEFVVALTGMIANPSMCGLMGCVHRENAAKSA